PPLFIATKLDAFHGRGGGDIVASHDLEDIIAVVDGRREIVSEVAAASADDREYIASELRPLLDNPTSLRHSLDSSSRTRRVRGGARACPPPRHVGEVVGLK